MFHICHLVNYISTSHGEIILPVDCPTKMLIKHVAMLSVGHVLKLITVPNNIGHFLKMKIKSLKCWAFFLRLIFYYGKTRNLLKNKLVPWFHAQLCFRSSSIHFDPKLIYVYLTQINEVLDLIYSGWFIIDKTHTDASSSNLIIRWES